MESYNLRKPVIAVQYLRSINEAEGRGTGQGQRQQQQQLLQHARAA